MIHAPLAERTDFDWIVASTSRYCDAIVTQPGLNSLLLWSNSPGLTRTSPVLITGWPLILPNEQQRQSIAKLGRSRSVCAVYNKPASDWWTNDDPELTSSSLAQQPLIEYIHGLNTIRKAGGYEIRGNAGAESLWKDDYMLDGVRDLTGERAAVAIPGDLAASAADLSFAFEVNHASLVLSIPRRAEISDEDVAPMEPVVSISAEGRLMIRARAGSYVALPGRASLFDGRWHELSLRRDTAGWVVVLDGSASGRIGELLSAGKPVRYLQLGPAFVGEGPGVAGGWAQFFGKIRDVRLKAVSSNSDAGAGSPSAVAER